MPMRKSSPETGLEQCQRFFDEGVEICQFVDDLVAAGLRTEAEAARDNSQEGHNGGLEELGDAPDHEFECLDFPRGR